MKILVTGSTGLVGSRFSELLSKSYEIEGLNRQNGIDITDESSVIKKISSSNAKLVLHLAAKTDVDGCESDKDVDSRFLEKKDFQNKEWISLKTAWVMNVTGTKNIIKACQKNKIKIIYVSTDFVFNGEKPITEGYLEEDSQDPINWYGQTKYEAEKAVQNSGLDWMILRPAYPYRTSYAKKSDFIRTMLQILKSGEKLSVVTDHIITPTFIDDFIYATDGLIKTNALGIFHTVGSQFISPFEIANVLAEKFNLDKSLINPLTRDEYFKDKAKRPFFLGLKNDKITKMGIPMKSLSEGLEEIKKQTL
jgi:dTDP-4-dehydrorhamnose reductase